MKPFLKVFIQGLLITVPIVITLLVFAKLIDWILSLLSRIGVIINPYVDPVVAVLVIVGIIFLVGLLGSTFLFTRIQRSFERSIDKTPLVKIIYSSIKDFLSAFVGSKKRFNKPVLVLIDKTNDIRQMGFITQTDLSEIGLREDKVAVYMPMSYAFSGKLIIVPKEYITPLDISSTDAMKFIVSGGVTDID